jgi:hypothetical protein
MAVDKSVWQRVRFADAEDRLVHRLDTVIEDRQDDGAEGLLAGFQVIGRLNRHDGGVTHEDVVLASDGRGRLSQGSWKAAPVVGTSS